MNPFIKQIKEINVSPHAKCNDDMKVNEINMLM